MDAIMANVVDVAIVITKIFIITKHSKLTAIFKNLFTDLNILCKTISKINLLVDHH